MATVCCPWSFENQKDCEKTVEDEPENLRYIPDHFKTQQICDKAVKDDSSSLQFVPDCFVTREGLYMWYEYCDDNDNEDNLFKWYDCYKKRKVQKASIKEELLPIAWHPLRYSDWYMSEGEKKRQKNCGDKYRPFLCLVTG